ncbi:MAG: GNAT family N-acetyltransferase [Candidatus Paceibacterota bacterium]
MEDFPKNSKEKPQNALSRRHATGTDVEFARKIHRAAMHDVVAKQFGSWDEEIQNESFDASWSPETSEIINDGDTKIGYCDIAYAPDYIYVRNLYISPEYQGKGVGTQILNEVLTKAKEMNIPVGLEVLKENQARELYKKLGFKDLEEGSTKYFMEFKPDEPEKV